MKLTEPVLQLYCVVSNHSLSTDYQWSSVSDGTIGVCGPVLYVQNTGIYRCTITDDRFRVCTSAEIEVVSGILHVSIIDVV